MNKTAIRRFLKVAVITCAGYVLAHPVFAQSAQPKQLTIAVIPDETDAEMIARYEGFSKYLTKKRVSPSAYSKSRITPP
ncbi:hypothetical protein ABK905_08085 [Acerihabitans sp. KWT182]|uniref:Inhibitor I9 domain-containing protein n=1 Tax=Acerihabitans sp. KWT182 TaxID=3157919 RepID=A0AAU7QCV5_9GAMM